MSETDEHGRDSAHLPGDRHTNRAVIWGASAAIAAAVITGIFSLLAAIVDDDGARGPTPAQSTLSASSPSPRPSSPQAASDHPTTGDSDVPLNGRVYIHPAPAPELCLTAGHTRDHSYPSDIAVQLRCSQAALPQTVITRTSDGHHHIHWEHPQHGDGCLWIRDNGPAENMLEPLPEGQCDRGTAFSFEPTDSGGYQIRAVDDGRCVTIPDRGQDGAEALVLACTGARTQQFLIDSADPS